jgi:hypothetical protein
MIINNALRANDKEWQRKRMTTNDARRANDNE